MSLAQMREAARQVVASSAPDDVALRDQVMSDWRQRLREFGIDVNDDKVMLGLLGGLRMAMWAIDQYFASLPPVSSCEEVQEEISQTLFGGQTFLLCMDPVSELEEFERSEGSES